MNEKRIRDIEIYNPEHYNINSVLNTELNRPKNELSQKTYKSKLFNFYKKEGISNTFLYQNKCNHFYRVKNNSDYHKYKTNSGKSQPQSKPPKKEECMVCKKKSITPLVAISPKEFAILWDSSLKGCDYDPLTFKSMAIGLIDEYTKHFRAKRDHYTYSLYDCEISFYKWLYNDTYE